MDQLISKKAEKENEERVEIEISKKSVRKLPLIEKFYKECANHLYKNEKKYMRSNQTSRKMFKRSGAQNNTVKGDGGGSCVLK